MTYRELLNLYKNGKLDEAQNKEIAAEIEKHDAISEFLYDEAQTDLFTEDVTISNELKTENEQLAGIIRESIRKILLKTGFISASVVLAITLIALAVLPHLVSRFYYNPNETMFAKESTGSKIDRMSLDLGVYTELFVPSAMRYQVLATANGYGDYDLTIQQTISMNNRFATINGKLKKGTLTLYRPEYFRLPVGNAFVLSSDVKYGAAGSQSDAYTTLAKLNPYNRYTGYISLKNPVDYAKFYQWLREKDLEYGNLWCAVCSANQTDYGPHIGFSPEIEGMVFGFDDKQYPLLSLVADNPKDFADPGDADAMKTHFLSLMDYMIDHPDILHMMGMPISDLLENRSYIENEPLRVYGFAICASPDALIELSHDPEVAYIYTTELQ